MTSSLGGAGGIVETDETCFGDVENPPTVNTRGEKITRRDYKEKHLHRYLAEYDFRYNLRVKLGYGDLDRTYLAIKDIESKRITYQQSH